MLGLLWVGAFHSGVYTVLEKVLQVREVFDEAVE